MTRFIPLTIVAVIASSCSGGDTADSLSDTASNSAVEQAADDGAVAVNRWDLQSSGEGVALALLAGPEETVVRLFCPAGGDQLLVNVPSFRPVGSEERLTFGSDGEVATIVADPAGDRARGGVTGAGEVPADLARLIAGAVAVNYGSQNSGPHSAPPAQAARAFVAACREGASSSPGGQDAPADPTPAPAPADVGACRMQDGATLPPNRLRAVGTEPFWGARVEGRCVTYSHPENQAGTRIWTKFSGTAEAGTWTGYYESQRFVMRTRPQPGCSDGMSDNRYPIAVTLEVAGERRSGCAQPN